MASITEQSAISFLSKLELSAAGLGEVSAAFEDGRTPQAIGILAVSLLFPESTHFPGTSDYERVKEGHWSLRARLAAGLVFTPDTCEAVSTAVKALSFFKIEFAIRSGGHTPFAGGAGTEGGVLLSLEKLNNLSLNEDKSITGVGAGLRWQAVYEYLADFGLACVGGRVPDVGVGGLLTGGGLSLHVNHYGFSCDMVQNFQVVLADGTIVNASSTENSDLFRALKGGSNNFGVVTRFDLYTVPAPNGVWGGLLMFLPDKYDQVLETLVEYQTTHQIEDSQSGMVLNFAFADSGKLQAVANYILHPEIDNPPSLSAWKELGPVMDLTKRAPLPVIVNETYNGFQILLATLRRDFRTFTTGISISLYKEIVALHYETFNALSHVEGIQSVLSFQPISLSSVRAGEAKGGNAMGVPAEPHTWFILTTSWADISDDELVLGAAAKLVNTIVELSKQQGKHHRFLYLNDAAGDQKVIESYGEEQVEFLKGVSARVDPTGVFQTLVKGGFKLPE